MGAASVVTDAGGLAQTTWQLAPALGAQSLTATATGVPAPATFTATAIPGPAAKLVFASAPTAGIAGTPLSSVVVTVLDALGNTASYTGAVTVALGSSPDGTALLGTTTVNAAAGVATFTSLRIRKAGGGYTLSASAVSLAGATSAAFNIATAPASTLALMSGNGQSGVQGTVLPAPITALVTDSCGNSVSGFPVTFQVSTGGGSVTPAAASTDANGTASTNWRLGLATGLQVMTAAGAGLTPPSVGVTAIAASLAQLAFGTQPTSVTAGVVMSAPVTVRALNASAATDTTFSGNITLAFASNPSGATLGGTLTVAAVKGVATFSTLSIRKAGAGFTLSASASGLGGATSSTFNVTAAPASMVTVVSGSGQSGPLSTALPSPLVALVSDSCGNPVGGVSVAWATGNGSVSPTPGTTGAAGTVSATWTLGATAGSATATATASPLTPAIFTATAIAPPAAYSKTWNGSVSTDWSTAANWTPSGVPTTSDSVLVPVTATNPLLTATTSIGKLTVATAATLGLNGNELDAYGPINAQGLISGLAPGWIYTFAGGSFAGNYAIQSLYLSANASLFGAMTNSGNITINGSGVLVLGGNTLTVTGSASAQLKMVNVADSVNVAGTFTVTASAAAANLTAGTIVVGGNFIQAGNYQSFPATGTHKVVMKGMSIPQHIQFFFPQNRYSHFNDLVIDNPAGIVMDSVSYDNGGGACGTPTCGGYNQVARHLTILNGTLSGTVGSYLRIGGTLTDAAGGRLTVPRVYFDSSTTPVSGTTPALSAPKVYFDGYYGGGAYLGPKRMALAGNLTVNGQLIFLQDDTLRLNGHSLTVTRQIGTLCCTTKSAIEMTNAADVLTVNGAFNVPRGVFTGGTIYADSAFIVQGVQASGSHKVVMRGGGSFYFAAGTSSTIDSTASGNWLNDVDLANSASDTLVIGGSVLVKGTLSKSTAAPTVFSGTNSLPGVVAVNGINVTQPTVWNRVPLAIVGSGSVALDNASFNNSTYVSGEDPALSGTRQWHLSVVRGGGGTYSLSGLNFSLTSSLPTPGANIWGFVNLSGPAALTLNLTGATPTAAGGGTARSQALGGATLNWTP